MLSTIKNQKISQKATERHYKKRLELVKRFEDAFNLTCIEPKPKREKSLWSCNICGNKIHTSINTLDTRLRRNSNNMLICEKCKQDEFMRLAEDIASEKGWKVHTEIINNLGDFVQWECDKGHKWSQTLGRAKTHGCQQCSTGEFITKDKCVTLWDEKGFDFLEDDYKGWNHKYKTQCKTCEHIWYPTYGNVKGNHGCPRCYSDNYDILDGKNDTDYFYPYIKSIFPSIVRGLPVHRYFVDYYIPELNVVIEYDEKHHYPKGELRQKDVKRQKEIERRLRCKFVRIKDELFMENNNHYTEELSLL